MKIFFPLMILVYFSMLFLSCKNQLTKKKAEELLLKSYAQYDPDEMGGSHSVVTNLIIDSIHEQGDTARVFYRVNGSIENGSKFPKEIDNTEQEDHFKQGIFGWKEK
ncbi:MAG: hypothetical protein H0W12_11675 [Chitinophagaceae bacterium]|nr:hypothetical protein [Chitinophagaceae bacterium]